MADAIYIDTEKIDEACNYVEKAYDRLIKDNIELLARQLLQIEGIIDLKNYTYIKNIEQEISNIVSKAKKVKEEYQKLRETSEEVTKISFPAFNQGIAKGKATKSTGQIMAPTPTDSVVNVKTDQSLQYNVINQSGYDEETITMVIEGLDEAIEKTKHKNDMAFEDEKRISESLSKEPKYLFNTDKMNFAVTTEDDFEEIYQEAKAQYPNKFTKETYKGLTEEEKTQFIKDFAEQKLSEKYQEHKAQFPSEWPENSYEELSQERKEEFLSLQATYRKVEIDTEIEENEESIASINYQKRQMEIALEVSKYEECIENVDFEKYSKENRVEVEERYKDELKYLSEAQQLVLTYLYSKEGKTKADEYIDSLNDQINKYKAAEETNEFIEKLENNPDELLEELENMGLTVKEGTKDGVNQYVEGLKNLYQDNYEPSVVEYKQMIVLEMLNKNPEWKTLLPKTYQISSSIGNMAPSIIISIGVTAATGGAGSPAVFSNMGRILGALSMGASATGNAKHQALMDGASICEAWAYGIATGSSETMLEYFLGSIPGIGKLGNKSAKTLTESIKVLGEKAVSEGIEEGLQQIIQTFSAEIIYGKEVNIDELMDETWDAATSGAICSIILNTGSSVMYKGQQVILSDADRQAINNYLNQNTDEGSEQAYSYLKNLLTYIYNSNVGIVAPGFQHTGVPAEYSTNIDLNQNQTDVNTVYHIDMENNEIVPLSGEDINNTFYKVTKEDKEKLWNISEKIISNGDSENAYQGQYLIFSCDNLDEYFAKYNLENPSARIPLAQYYNRFDIVKREFSKIQLSDYQRNKLEEIKRNNGEWYETLNIEILDSKYSFLDKYLDFLVTDVNAQQLLLSLNEEELSLFQKMFERLDNETSQPIKYIDTILTYIGNFRVGNVGMLKYVSRHDLFSKLAKLFQNSTITDKDLDLLIYIFSQGKPINIDSIEQLRNLDNIMLSNLNNSIDEIKNKDSFTEEDLENVKSILLQRSYGYGFDLNECQEYIQQYNLDEIDVNNYNENYRSMYNSILNIVNETDINKLFKIYELINNDSSFEIDYLTSILFETGINDIFLKYLNEKTFKCTGNNYKIKDGVKIYDAGTDFNIILTSVGSYGNLESESISNWFELWNNNLIRSHCSCCSLIANNNLSTANISNYCMGFANFYEGMFLNSSLMDINSTPSSKNLNPLKEPATIKNWSSFIDNTRTTYNEVLFERRDLSPDKKYYKKNPDYIVLFKEFEDTVSQEDLDEKTQNLLKYEKQISENSIKAAKDFNVPIVEINREICAKSESKKIDNMVDEFYKTHNIDLLTRIVVDYENNRMGLRNPHEYLRNKYFPKQKINKILSDLIIHINNIDDINLKNNIKNHLESVIKEEQKKFTYNKGKRTYDQEAGIDFDKILELLNSYN